MHDHHVLQMNEAKGRIESVLAQLDEQDLTSFRGQNFRTRSHIIERLKAVQTELAELVTLAGEISIEPIPPSPQTAWEIASALVGAHSVGDGSTNRPGG